jgi:choline kinase
MKIAQITNRDGDIIYFREVNEHIVHMTGFLGNTLGVTGEAADGYIVNITSVDPSGGPHIAIGDKIPGDLGWVTGIDIEDGVVILTKSNTKIEE